MGTAVPACRSCGYDLSGSSRDTILVNCPECGTFQDLSRVENDGWSAAQGMRALYSPAACSLGLGLVVALAPALLLVVSLFGFFGTIGFAAFLFRCGTTRQWRRKILMHAPIAAVCALVMPWLPVILWMHLIG
jgi:hypothetical protein